MRGIAHRMNNILTLFHGYLGLLLERNDLDEETLEGLAKIKEGASAASELMDRTHSLARPSTLVWREVAVGEFLRTMRPFLENFAGPTTKLEYHIADDVPPAWADAARVKTIMSELIRNALEATHAKGGTVRVKVQAVAAPVGSRIAKAAPWVSITVSDDGPGIPENARERVFQPFFSTKKRRANAGLGLTVALTFVQHLGGMLRSQSSPGETQFEVLLPSRAQRDCARAA